MFCADNCVGVVSDSALVSGFRFGWSGRAGWVGIWVQRPQVRIPV